jgi:hypothetical protein
MLLTDRWHVEHHRGLVVLEKVSPYPGDNAQTHKIIDNTKEDYLELRIVIVLASPSHR